jgi:hypothetical protein
MLAVLLPLEIATGHRQFPGVPIKPQFEYTSL